MVAVTYDVWTCCRYRDRDCRQAREGRAAQGFLRPLHGCADRGAHGAGAARDRAAYQLLPYSLDERGNRLVKTGSHDMPFGGW